MTDRQLRNAARDYASNPSDRNAQAIARHYMRANATTGEYEPCEDCAQHRENDPQRSYGRDVINAADYLPELASEAEDRDDLFELFDQFIDGHQRVIYTTQAMECLRYSSNDGEAVSQLGPDCLVRDGAINWSLLAFFAFRQDVIDHAEGAGFDINDPFSCPECGNGWESGEGAANCCDAESVASVEA
jgi:hypothetical protein